MLAKSVKRSRGEKKGKVGDSGDRWMRWGTQRPREVGWSGVWDYHPLLEIEREDMSAHNCSSGDDCKVGHTCIGDQALG